MGELEHSIDFSKIKFDALDTREEKVVRMYYGIGFSKSFTAEEIGYELNMPAEHVLLMKDKAIKKAFGTDNHMSNDGNLPVS